MIYIQPGLFLCPALRTFCQETFINENISLSFYHQSLRHFGVYTTVYYFYLQLWVMDCVKCIFSFFLGKAMWCEKRRGRKREVDCIRPAVELLRNKSALLSVKMFKGWSGGPLTLLLHWPLCCLSTYVFFFTDTFFLLLFCLLSPPPLRNVAVWALCVFSFLGLRQALVHSLEADWLKADKRSWCVVNVSWDQLWIFDERGRESCIAADRSGYGKESETDSVRYSLQQTQCIVSAIFIFPGFYI